MGMQLQPHESHLPFELQFMMDYNLYGMGFIHIGRRGGEPDEGVKFRNPMPERVRMRAGGAIEEGGDHIAPHVYTIETVPAWLIWSADRVGRAAERQTRCELEVDTTVMAILNRDQAKERDLHADFGEAVGIWKGKKGRGDGDREQDEVKLVKSLAMLWEVSLGRIVLVILRNFHCLPSSLTLFFPTYQDESRRRYFQDLPTTIPPVTQHEDRAPHLPWSDEPRLREMVRRLVEADATVAREVGDRGHDDTMRRLVERDGYDRDVMTAYQAVEALYPRREGDGCEEGSEDRKEIERDADELREEASSTGGPASSSHPPQDPTITSIPKFTRSMSDLARLCPPEDSPTTCHQLSQESAVIVDAEVIRLSQENGDGSEDDDVDQNEDVESNGESNWGSDGEMEILEWMTREGDGGVKETEGDGENGNNIQVEDAIG